MSEPLERITTGRAIEPIVVDPDGNAYTDLTREKESVIRSERLDSAHPVVHVNLETIITEHGGSAVVIVVQDFGLPPRLINIYGDFNTMHDVAGISREDEHYASAPKTLSMSAPSKENGRTYSFDYDGRPSDEASSVELSRGEAMLWAHEGTPSDERTGYIEYQSFYELIGLRPRDYYGKPDFKGEHPGLSSGYTPLIGINYANNVLSIYSLDDAHAEVLYQQVKSLSDEVGDYADPEGMSDDFNLPDVITRLSAGDAEAQELIEQIMAERAEALLATRGLKTQLLQARTGIDNMETVVAVTKKRLREARREAAELARDVERLKRQASTSEGTAETEGNIFDFISGRKMTESDPHGYCSTIGLIPEFLFAQKPEIAKRLVQSVQRGLARGLHSDVSGGSDEPMKLINAAADAIFARLEQGYWGRR
jgi:hypothetical protein